MSGGDGRVWWRGVQLDARTAAMMDEVNRLVGKIVLHPSQGSWSGASASAGTHSGCGAIDLTRLSAAECDTVVAAMRRVGFAAWHRTPQQSNWQRHCHGIAVQPGGKHDRGCLHPSAAAQVVDYYEGRNGLANRGRDDATRAYVGTTWETYRRPVSNPTAPAPEEDHDMRIITSPKRGSALYGPGYFKTLTDEAYRVLVGQGIVAKKGNDREFDLIKAAVLQGASAADD